MYSLSDFQKKEGILILFICNHCPYVKAKIDTIVKLYEKYKDRIAFVGINSNDPEYEGEGMENMIALGRYDLQPLRGRDPGVELFGEQETGTLQANQADDFHDQQDTQKNKNRPPAHVVERRIPRFAGEKENAEKHQSRNGNGGCMGIH